MNYRDRHLPINPLSQPLGKKRELSTLITTLNEMKKLLITFTFTVYVIYINLFINKDTGASLKTKHRLSGDINFTQNLSSDAKFPTLDVLFARRIVFFGEGGVFFLGRFSLRVVLWLLLFAAG